MKKNWMLCVIVLLSLGSAAWSQDTNTVSPDAADKAAARQTTNLFREAQPTKTKLGMPSRGGEAVLTQRPSSGGKKSGNSFGRNDVRYPGDLSFQGGAVVDSAQSHAIYLLPNGKCPISQCWGNPEGFLRDVSDSQFIHLVDQYVGLRASERYTLGSRAKVNYAPPTVPLTDTDVLSVVHAVASAAGGSGYGHIFHVFLPPGQDECFDSTFAVCYSPDNFDTFFFCAYHGSADFTDIGHVLYSVEPYQNVPGCQVRPGTPNGQLADSTNDVLSHELIETITDPDGDAWWNSTGLSLYGQEIGDECIFLLFTSSNVYSDPFIFKIDDDLYAIQPEYSNAAHGCAVR
ncbi:MAG: hypothetical protein ACRD20_09720 [Terriglobales bacterium]